MKHGWFRVSISGMMILSLLTGYASSTEIKPAVQQAVNSPEPVSTDGSQPVVQNRKEREMVLLFQALLQMDRKEGLSISNEQAAALLPLIRNSRDQGNLTADQQKQALEFLNVDQQAFYNDLAIKMKDSMNRGAGKNFDHLTQEERDKLIEQFKNRRNHPPPAASSRGEGEGPSGQGFGKSMEQQLVDLLESKVKL
ncbi:hypothetical protein [Paenibacillus sp. GP183]|uniref:hypothetical protein n=1 Tax=Paenibacillus sp. GP183 TaxID=1882751 RepID=UPI00089CD3F6|nr:hypothetical protein [Paenibacillus sp. GP183]SEB60309.1 hypothetical protein SAMN05443246_1270 [Paenibacillus sp. GP183]